VLPDSAYDAPRLLKQSLVVPSTVDLSQLASHPIVLAYEKSVQAGKAKILRGARVSAVETTSCQRCTHSAPTTDKAFPPRFRSMSQASRRKHAQTSGTCRVTAGDHAGVQERCYQVELLPLGTRAVKGERGAGSDEGQACLAQGIVGREWDRQAVGVGHCAGRTGWLDAIDGGHGSLVDVVGEELAEGGPNVGACAVLLRVVAAQYQADCSRVWEA